MRNKLFAGYDPASIERTRNHVAAAKVALDQAIACMPSLWDRFRTTGPSGQPDIGFYDLYEVIWQLLVSLHAEVEIREEQMVEPCSSIRYLPQPVGKANKNGVKKLLCIPNENEKLPTPLSSYGDSV